MASKRTIEIVIKGKDEASKALGGVGKALGGLTKAAAIGGVAVAGLGIGAGAAFLKLAKDAAPIEGIQRAFEGLTKSFEGGSGAMLRTLEENSLGMIDNTELMRGFNEAAQLVSVDFASKLPNAMQYLSKVSAATGQDMDFMMSSLTTGIGRLSPMILDNLGIQVDVAAANQVWADKMGVATEAMSKADQQAALYDQVLEKLKINTADMPEITENASTKMAQFDVTMKNATDQIGLALLPIFTDLMGAVGDFATENLPILISTFQDEVIPFIQENVIPIIQELWEWFGTYLPGVIALLKSYIETVLIPAFTQVWNFIQDPVIPIITELVAWLQVHVPAAIAALGAWWENTGKGIFQTVVNFLKDPVISIISNVVNWLQVHVPAAIAALGAWWDNTGKEIFQTVVNFIEEPVISTLSTLFDWFATNVPNAISELSAWWDNTGKVIFQTVVDFIEDPVIKILSDLVTWVAEKVVGAFNALSTWWHSEGGGAQIWNIISSAIGNATSGIQSFINMIADAIQAIKDFANARIDLPFGLNLNPITGEVGKDQHQGGFWPAGGLASLHSNEMVLPLGSQSGVDMLASAMRQAAGQTIFNLTANYPNRDREDLASDVRLLQLTYGAA